MAHYFKFRTVADIATESARLGLDLRFSDDFDASLSSGHDRPAHVPATRFASSRWKAATARSTAGPTS